MRQYKFWNREADAGDACRYRDLLEFSPESVVREAKILSLSAPDDEANASLHAASGLPLGCTLLGVGSELSDFAHLRSKGPSDQPNVLFVSPSCPRASAAVPLVLAAFPSLKWVHVRSAGLDFVASEDLAALCARSGIQVTNAKGQFSSSLAEYALLACSYFAKNVPRLIRQQAEGRWEKYDIEELRGKTLGVVGYGDIGKACVKLAYVFWSRAAWRGCRFLFAAAPRNLGCDPSSPPGARFVLVPSPRPVAFFPFLWSPPLAPLSLRSSRTVYGMRVVALRRHPFLSRDDPYCDRVYGRDRESLVRLMGESDYVVCSAPSTVETRGMVGAEAFEAVKPGAVFVNLGRGPVVDEAALVRALQSGRLKGAALDVFAEEPLPPSSELWGLPNVLLSPHNMDQTATFMHEATEFFLRENLPRFVCGEDLLNPVDPALGY
jgi:phosphoglycerate dehydrogenase-like enzyme